MSEQFHAAMKDIIAMPYFKNEHAQSKKTEAGHERAVAEKLAANGFTEERRDNFPGISAKLFKDWMDTSDDSKLKDILVDMKLGSYIVQPASSQDPPDICVRDFDGRFVALECKSGKGDGAPMWNDNLPKQDVIYILSSGNRNETTVFLGRDVITPEIYAKQKAMWEEIKEVSKRYYPEFVALDSKKRGWHPKSRAQNFQKNKDGGNYFKHVDRSQCEANVLLEVLRNGTELSDNLQ